MGSPRIDVVITGYNAQLTVEPAVRSIMGQTLRDLTITFVDDGSTDGTVAIVARLAREDDRIRLLSGPNRGPGAAARRGTDAGDAPFVARMDADDISAPKRLQRQIAAFESQPDLVGLSALHEEIGEDGVPTGHVHSVPANWRADPLRLPAEEAPLIHPFLMVRREALVRAGGYRPFPTSEDSDLYWRLLRVGRLAVLPEVLGRYRMHAGSLSSASVVRGRMMAVCSQLAALSSVATAAGGADPAEPVPTRAEFDAAMSLEAMFALIAPRLDADQARWLRVAVAGKMMELAGYRPYELERGDCTFICAALREADGLAETGRMTKQNRRALSRMTAATAARLLRLGRVADAARLAPARLWPQAGARAALRRLYWKKHLAAS